MSLWRFEWDSLRRRVPSVRFREFFAALPQERAFCIPCLARLSTVPEDTVRRELQTLAPRVESRLATCWTCEQTEMTYRMKAGTTTEPVSK